MGSPVAVCQAIAVCPVMFLAPDLPRLQVKREAWEPKLIDIAAHDACLESCTVRLMQYIYIYIYMLHALSSYCSSDSLASGQPPLILKQWLQKSSSKPFHVSRCTETSSECICPGTLPHRIGTLLIWHW